MLFASDNVEQNDKDKKNVSDIDSMDLSCKWVTTEYSKENNATEFKGQVMNAHDYSNDYVMVKFLTQMAPEKYVWPEVDDIDIFSRYMYS